MSNYSKDINTSPNEKFIQKLAGISPQGYPPIDPHGMNDGPDTDALAQQLYEIGVDCSGMDSYQVLEAYRNAQEQGMFV